MLAIIPRCRSVWLILSVFLWLSCVLSHLLPFSPCPDLPPAPPPASPPPAEQAQELTNPGTFEELGKKVKGD